MVKSDWKYKSTLTDNQVRQFYQPNGQVQHIQYVYLASHVMCKNCWQPLENFTHPAVGRDEAGNAHQPSISKKPGHLRNPSNVLFTILWAKSQVFVQPLADIVSIQSIARDAVTNQVLLQCHAHCGLPCTRQPWTDGSTSVIEGHGDWTEVVSAQVVPVSHTVHPLNPPLVPTTWPRLFRLTWWAW